MQPSSARRRLPPRWPIATVSVLTVTAVLTVLQYPFPQVRLALWRDPGALAAGQWWRLVTPQFVQYDAVWQIVVVFACIAGVGVLAERIFGHGRWLLLYLTCGVVGQAFGYRWEPPDAGASVAGAGLLGAVCAWLLSPDGPRQVQVRVWGILWPLAGVALTVKGDQHGPPLLVGFGLGGLLLWLDRRRVADDRAAVAAGPGPGREPPGTGGPRPAAGPAGATAGPAAVAIYLATFTPRCSLPGVAIGIWLLLAGRRGRRPAGSRSSLTGCRRAGTATARAGRR